MKAMDIEHFDLYNKAMKAAKAKMAASWRWQGSGRARKGLRGYRNVHQERKGGYFMIVPKYYETLQMLHDHVMPDRSYYIP